jgi:hypothetical protein
MHIYDKALGEESLKHIARKRKFCNVNLWCFFTSVRRIHIFAQTSHEKWILHNLSRDVCLGQCTEWKIPDTLSMKKTVFQRVFWDVCIDCYEDRNSSSMICNKTIINQWVLRWLPMSMHFDEKDCILWQHYLYQCREWTLSYKLCKGNSFAAVYSEKRV